MSSSASVKLRYEKCLQIWGNAKTGMTSDTFKPEARKTAGLTLISARSSKAGQTS